MWTAGIGGRATGTTRASTWILVGLVALGAFVRFYKLGAQSLWVDELITIAVADLGGPIGQMDVFRIVQGPLHAVLVHLVSNAATSEAALRSLSAVFGTALIPVVYLLGLELSGRRAALLAALLLAVSPFCVWYSQEVRNYSLLMFFSGLSTLLVWRLVVKGSRAWPAYAVSVFLALLSNFAAVFLAVAHNLFAARRALSEPQFRRQWVLIHVFVLLLVTPWMWGLMEWAQQDEVAERVVLTPLASDEELIRGATTFTPMAVPYALYAMSYGFTLGPSLRSLHEAPPAAAVSGYMWLLVPASCAYALAVLSGLAGLRSKRDALRLALIVCIVPIAGAAVLALLNVKPMNARYVCAMLPVYVVLAGAGISRLRKGIAVAVSVLILLFSGVALGNYFNQPEYRREDVRGAVRHISAHEQSGDVILVPVVTAVFDFYYSGESSRFMIPPRLVQRRTSIDGVVRSKAAGCDRLWYLEARKWQGDPGGLVLEYLQSRFTQVDRVDLAGVRLFLFDLAGGRVAD